MIMSRRKMMNQQFVNGFCRGCLYGCAVVGVSVPLICAALSFSGYTITKHRITVPIDCKDTA